VATANDVDTVAARHADLAAADLLPAEHLVDAGYVSVDHVLDGRADHGVELVGPLPPDSGWQARDEAVFDLTRFHIDWDRQQVICPNGKTSRNWRQTSSRYGLPIIQATFRAPDCTPCPDRARCTRSPVLARHLTFRPRHPVRDPAATPRRAGHRRLAGALCRPCGHRGHHRPGRPPRRPPPGRYRGLAKTHLQHVLTALALNLVRVDAWLSGTPPGGTWVSRLTRLRAPPSPV
jgi:Transposase DDE domain